MANDEQTGNTAFLSGRRRPWKIHNTSAHVFFTLFVYKSDKSKITVADKGIVNKEIPFSFSPRESKPNTQENNGQKKIFPSTTKTGEKAA